MQDRNRYGASVTTALSKSLSTSISLPVIGGTGGAVLDAGGIVDQGVSDILAAVRLVATAPCWVIYGSGAQTATVGGTSFFLPGNGPGEIVEVNQTDSFAAILDTSAGATGSLVLTAIVR